MSDILSMALEISKKLTMSPSLSLFIQITVRQASLSTEKMKQPLLSPSLGEHNGDPIGVWIRLEKLWGGGRRHCAPLQVQHHHHLHHHHHRCHHSSCHAMPWCHDDERKRCWQNQNQIKIKGQNHIVDDVSLTTLLEPEEIFLTGCFSLWLKEILAKLQKGGEMLKSFSY